jgi:hypothetical protein
MTASIAFTDSVGAATLVNNFPGTRAERFTSWTPMTRPIGDGATTLATGSLTFFEQRTDFGASFDLVGIPVKAASGGTNLVAIADRLIAHLMRGGTCNVTTGDSLASVYATCGLWPGSSPSLSQSDKTFLEYTLSLQLLNVAVSPVRMDCVYL